MRRYAALLFALMGWLSCSGDPASPGVPGDLAKRQALWAALDIRDYDFRVHYSNEWFAGEEALVHVRNGTVESVTDIESGNLIITDPASWPTVDSLFAYARRAVDDPEQEVALLFDGTLHYPRSVRIDAPQWADDAQRWTTRNLVKR